MGIHSWGYFFFFFLNVRHFEKWNMHGCGGHFIFWNALQNS
jgi:hypothetical protein